MKRIISLFLAVSLVFLLTACVGQSFDVNTVLEEANALIASGELEQAESVLNNAIIQSTSQQDTQLLEACLESVHAAMQSPVVSSNGSAPTAPTEAPTEVTSPTATTEPFGELVSSNNLLMGFSRDDIYLINIFLSNFAEQNFQKYPCDNYALVQFAFLFAKYNANSMVSLAGNEYVMTNSDVAYVTNRFFGQIIYLDDPTTLSGPYGQVITFSNNKFYYPAADGASISYCSFASNMTRNSDGTYTVLFDVYSHIDPHESMSAFYSMTWNEAKSDSRLQYVYSGTAVVRDYIREDGVSTYQLISYSR